MIIKKGLFSTREINCTYCNGVGFCKSCKGKGKITIAQNVLTEKGLVKVKCPKCETIIPIFNSIRPLEFNCPKCEMKLLLKK